MKSDTIASSEALPIDKIKLDGGTQSRGGVTQSVVDEYAAVIREGSDFPPVTVFHDGKKYWLADGFHRVAAYRDAGAMEIPVAVHQGTRRDAVLFSVGANAAHGLRRTNDDKRRAVMTLLNDKEWAAWSDRQIAKQCGVHHEMVGRLRDELSGGKRQIERVVKRGDSTFTMDTANIGKPSSDDHPPLPKPDSDQQRQSATEQLSPELQQHIADTNARRAQSGTTAPAAIGISPDDLEELTGTIAAMEEEIAELRRKVATFDGMVVEYERGGFENVIDGLNQRIEVLQRQVERESQEKVANLRSAEYWKKKAIASGANDDVVIDMATGEMSRG